MRDKVFYIIDNFCPAALYDQTVIRNDMFYVIVNTFIINKEGFDECPLIADYLDPATQAASYKWEYLGANVTAMNIVKNDPSCLIPVPPPLNVPFSFAFNGKTLNNKLGFEFLSEEEKVDWIRQSNSSVVVNLSQKKTGINYFDYITYPQLVTLNKWFAALLTEVFRKKTPGEITDALEKKIFDCGWTGENPDQFRENFISKIETQQATISPTKKLPLGITNFFIAKYCNLLVTEGADITSSFVPDPLRFSDEALAFLKTKPAEAKAELGADKNYRRILCQNIAAEKDPAKLVERLQFFYGAGERVRINRDPGISIMKVKDIDTPEGMQLNPDGTQTGWMETNAYSFCGQVAAIPFDQVQLPSFETTFTITAGAMNLLTMLSVGDRKNYFDSIKAYIHNIKNNDHTRFKRTISFPATYVVNTTTLNQEKTNYYPVNALLDHNFRPYPIQLGTDSFLTAIKLPEALLDALVDKPKVSYQGDGKDAAFLTLNPQRMLLREDDLFKKDGTNEVKFIPMENSIELKNFLPAIVLSVQVRRVALPELQKQVFKISRKASVPITSTDPASEDVVAELKELRKLLYGPGDILRMDDFVFRIRKVDPAADIILSSIWTDGKVDDDEMIEIYAEGLASLFNQGNSQGVKDTVDVDLLIIPVQNIPNMFKRGFNLLLHKDASKTVFIALDKHYNFRFNVSVNGFSRAMEVTLDKNGFINSGQGAIEPLLFDYTNFNKFRIAVKNGEELKLNTNDALLPLSEHGSEAMPQKFHYRTTHRFAEEVNSQNNDTNQENRYKLYRLNVNPLSLKAKIENQYAFRLAVELGGIRFPHSNPIRNLGDLKTTEVDGDLVSTIPLLTYALSDKNDKLILTLNKKYLQSLLRRQDELGAAQMTVYRNLYEAFFDALNNISQFALELWNFNNTRHGLDAEEAAHPETSREWPSIMKHLERVKTELLQVDFSDLLKSFNKPTFKEFKDAINAYTDGAITHTKTISLSTDLSTDIGNTNLVRLGLLITRADSKTVREQFAGGIPVAADIRPFPLKGEDDLGTSFAFTRTEVARTALQSYLDSGTKSNALFNSFSYVSSEWYDLNKPPTGTSADQRMNVKELLGETTSFIWRPKGLAPNKTDMLLYYVPYSFRPLQVHPKLLDLKTTVSFAEYVLRILAWLAYPEKQKEDPRTFLVNITDINNSEILFKTKLRARGQLLPSIAEKLAMLLTYVDNRPEASTHPHYQLVSAISKRIEDSLGKAFKSMLIEDPVKYITAKGFGVGLFSGVSTQHLGSPSVLPRDGEMRDLYMLQLIKDIRKPLPPGVPGQALKSNDVTRVNFKAFLEENSGSGVVSDRYFVETLEDALFDNEFQISEQGNAQSEPFDASQVRTAEDLLENNNRFNEQNAADKPAKFAVAHYCPDWISQQNEKFYLLPSRTPPSTPVPYMPVQTKLLKHSEKDWDKLVIKQSAVLSLSFSPKDPPVEFESRGVAYNKKLDEIKSKFWDRWDIFINTYDYIIEPDEEGELKNDLFEIYLTDKMDAPANNTLNDAATDIPNSDIFKQFEFYVRKKEGAVKPLDLKTLVPLDGTPGVIENFLDELLKPGIEDETNTTADIRLRQENSGQFTLNINSNFALRERVLSAEVFRVKGAPADQPVKHVIRVKVLSDPWSHYRCRLRVRRNMRDIDSDGRFDINPAFVINSAFSTWTDYGVQSLGYDYLSNVEESAEWNTALKYLESSSLSYAGYRDKITKKDPKPIPFGDLLLQHLNTNKKLFVIEELSRKGRLFNAYIEEKIRSSAPQLFHKSKDLSSIIAYKKLATDSLAKSGIAKITADTISNFKVVPETIRSHEPVLHVRWYSIEDPTKEAFSMSLKLKLK